MILKTVSEEYKNKKNVKKRERDVCLLRNILDLVESSCLQGPVASLRCRNNFSFYKKDSELPQTRNVWLISFENSGNGGNILKNRIRIAFLNK